MGSGTLPCTFIMLWQQLDVGQALRPQWAQAIIIRSAREWILSYRDPLQLVDLHLLHCNLLLEVVNFAFLGREGVSQLLNNLGNNVGHGSARVVDMCWNCLQSCKASRA